MNPHIRRAEPEDFPVMAQIYSFYTQEQSATMDRGPKTAAYFEEMTARFGKREELWVWDGDHGVFGYGVIKAYSDRLGYQTTCEASVYLASDRVGRGLGTQMKRHLIQRCRALKYHHVVAKIGGSNKASIASNKKCGFTVVGVQKEVCVVNGAWDDVVIMQLLLNEGPPPSHEDGGC